MNIVDNISLCLPVFNIDSSIIKWFRPKMCGWQWVAIGLDNG